MSLSEILNDVFSQTGRKAERYRKTLFKAIDDYRRAAKKMLTDFTEQKAKRFKKEVRDKKEAEKTYLHIILNNIFSKRDDESKGYREHLFNAIGDYRKIATKILAEVIELKAKRFKEGILEREEVEKTYLRIKAFMDDVFSRTGDEDEGYQKETEKTKEAKEAEKAYLEITCRHIKEFLDNIVSQTGDEAEGYQEEAKTYQEEAEEAYRHFKNARMLTGSDIPANPYRGMMIIFLGNNESYESDCYSDEDFVKKVLALQELQKRLEEASKERLRGCNGGIAFPLQENVNAQNSVPHGLDQLQSGSFITTQDTGNPEREVNTSEEAAGVEEKYLNPENQQKPVEESKMEDVVHDKKETVDQSSALQRVDQPKDGASITTQGTGNPEEGLNTSGEAAGVKETDELRQRLSERKQGGRWPTGLISKAMEEYPKDNGYTERELRIRIVERYFSVILDKKDAQMFEKAEDKKKVRIDLINKYQERIRKALQCTCLEGKRKVGSKKEDKRKV
ncbi:MAG: hypothetical protein WCK32_09060 [Chlorobiaceae bacterium]